ncbi:hypothetical protein E3U43_014301 [Larimichthys crocea]|uniref:Uncharacterized protein n=1 Tax=Larimichthys crocea TaxID=215358 RepID=A0ACD3RC45_LARCR|nr:hypothetical protein E3U43_014301 [Larimichthys crocea]
MDVTHTGSSMKWPIRLRHSADTERRFSVSALTWSAMLRTPISQTQPGRSSFMRIKLRAVDLQHRGRQHFTSQPSRLNRRAD